MDPCQVCTAGLINTKFIKGLYIKPRRAPAREAEKEIAEQESVSLAGQELKQKASRDDAPAAGRCLAAALNGERGLAGECGPLPSDWPVR